MSESILLLGAGPMAIEYSKILQSLNQSVITVGRGEASAKEYQQQTGLTAITGGYQAYLSQTKTLPDTAIVAVGEKWLGDATRQLIEHGVKTILVEKPGGVDAQDIRQVAELATEKGANVYVAYNRRFYSSVKKARSIIEEDGGLQSFHFEFTEWGHVIADLQKEPGVKENWFLANSTHVIDLAFFLGGEPKTLTGFCQGELSWHPRGANYAGAGVTQTGALFTYQANWQAPGRWGLEFLTKQHRLYFRPMEQLQIQKLGSVAVNPVEIDDAIDQDFKPGLYAEVESFLGDKHDLPNIQQQVAMLEWYEKINNRH